MTTISADIIDDVWERLSNSDEEQIQAVVRRVQEEQPFIMVYLLAMDENVVEPEERGLLLQLGAYVLEIVHTIEPGLRVVTGQELEIAEKENMRRLEALEEGSDMDLQESVLGLFNDYHQMPLLGAVLEALMADYEDAPELAPDNVGLCLIYLKTVIDCLDAAASSP